MSLHTTHLRLKTLVAAMSGIALAVGLSACGGSSGSTAGTNEPPEQSGPGNEIVAPATISGVVMAPDGALAHFDRANFTQLAGRFLLGHAIAAMSGLQPINGGTVELIRIDNDGEQVGDVLAQATVSSTGHYLLEFPADLDLSANLVLRVTGSNDAQLRAVATHATVDIDPVSEFVLRQLTAADIDLGALAVNEVVRLRGQLDGFDIPAGGTIDDAIANLTQETGALMAAELDEIKLGAGTLSAAAEYRAFGLTLVLGQNQDAHEVWSIMDTQGRTLSLAPGADAGRVDVTAGGTTFIASAANLPFGGTGNAGFWVENEIDGVEQFTARLNASGAFTLDIPFMEELVDDDFAVRVPPSTLRFRPMGDYGYIGQHTESELLYGRESADGPLDLNDARGRREGLELSLLVSQADGAPTLQDRYGFVIFEQGLGMGGCVETAVSHFHLDNPDEGTYAVHDFDEMRVQSSGCVAPEAPDMPLELGLSGQSGGAFILSAEGEPVISGAADAGGNLLLAAVLDQDEQGEEIAWVMKGMSVAVALPQETPDLADTSWDLYEIATTYASGSLVDLFGYAGTRLTFNGDGSLKFAPLREVLIARTGEAGTPARRWEFEEEVVIGSGEVNVVQSGGRVSITVDDEDPTEFSGFVSADGQMMVLVEYADGGDEQSAGLIIGIRR